MKRCACLQMSRNQSLRWRLRSICLSSIYLPICPSAAHRSAHPTNHLSKPTIDLTNLHRSRYHDTAHRRALRSSSGTTCAAPIYLPAPLIPRDAQRDHADYYRARAVRSKPALLRARDRGARGRAARAYLCYVELLPLLAPACAVEDSVTWLGVHASWSERKLFVVTARASIRGCHAACDLVTLLHRDGCSTTATILLLARIM